MKKPARHHAGVNLDGCRGGRPAPDAARPARPPAEATLRRLLPMV